MSARAVVAAFAAAILACAAAGIAVVRSATVATNEREALIQFVCASVEIQARSGSPAAAEYRQRFNQILARLGEEPCPTTP